MTIKLKFEIGEEVYFYPEDRYSVIHPNPFSRTESNNAPVKAKIHHVIVDNEGAFFYFKFLDAGFKVPIDQVFREKECKEFMKRDYSNQISELRRKIKELDNE